MQVPCEGTELARDLNEELKQVASAYMKMSEYLTPIDIDNNIGDGSLLLAAGTSTSRRQLSGVQALSTW